MRKKSKNKSKVRVRKDKKGRYLKFEGKKHYLKPKGNITERDLIHYLVKTFAEKKRRKRKQGKSQSKIKHDIGGSTGTSSVLLIQKLC